MGRQGQEHGAKVTAIAWVLGVGIGLWLLFRYPKKMGITIAVVVALATAGAGVLYWVQSTATRNHEAEVATLKTKARADSSVCTDPAYPIAVAFHNTSNRILEYVTFNLEARRPGYSSAVYSNYQTSDRILQPDDVYTSCWSLASYKNLGGHQAADLDWSVAIYSVRFQ